MTICDNCGWTIREGRMHEKEIEGQQCIVVESDTKRPLGFSRRKLAKNLYKR